MYMRMKNGKNKQNNNWKNKNLIFSSNLQMLMVVPLGCRTPKLIPISAGAGQPMDCIDDGLGTIAIILISWIG